MPKLPNGLSLKQRVFIEKTIETLNPTEAAVQAYDVNNRRTATAIATENLAKPTIRQEILKRMEERGLNVDTITSIHKRNIKQSKNYAASNTALDMLYNLSEAYPVQKTINTNINIDLNTLEEKRKEIQDELKRIRDGVS